MYQDRSRIDRLALRTLASCRRFSVICLFCSHNICALSHPIPCTVSDQFKILALLMIAPATSVRSRRLRCGRRSPLPEVRVSHLIVTLGRRKPTRARPEGSCSTIYVGCDIGVTGFSMRAWAGFLWPFLLWPRQKASGNMLITIMYKLRVRAGVRVRPGSAEYVANGEVRYGRSRSRGFADKYDRCANFRCSTTTVCARPSPTLPMLSIRTRIV